MKHDKENIGTILAKLKLYHQGEDVGEPLESHFQEPVITPRTTGALTPFSEVRRYVEDERLDGEETRPVAFKHVLHHGLFHEVETTYPVGPRTLYVSALGIHFPDVETDPVMVWVANPEDHRVGTFSALSDGFVYAVPLDAEHATGELQDPFVEVVRTEATAVDRWWLKDFGEFHPDSEDPIPDADDGHWPEDPGGGERTKNEPERTET